MRFFKSWRWGPIVLAIALSILALPARAAITPESDVLLPWFEIDLERHDVGLATSFSVVNASPRAVNTRFVVYTNWGIPILEVPLAFDRAEAKSIDLRTWIIDGVLSNRILTPGELEHLHAALTGMRSPITGLYYGSPVHEGIAVGYVIAQTLDDRPDSLWGDTYTIDLTADYFGAETLMALTHGLEADCKRHGVRFVNEGALYQGDEIIIWSGRRFEPSATPNPAGPKMKVTVAIYDQAGNHVHDCHRELIAVESVMVCHLEGIPAIGWLDIRTEDPSFILEHLHSIMQASAELHSYCLREDLKFEGPAIELEKKVLETDADRPPGPKIDAGDEIEFEYYVTNSGTVVLTNVSVTDDAGLEVTCPKATLAPGETMVCKALTTAQGCLNTNLGTASGTAPDGVRVSATDLANYTGVYAAEVTLETLVNDDQADLPTGPYVVTGQPLQWTFVVTNSGNARLDGITVELKHGENATCPKTALDPGESMTCTATSLALEGQQHEIGTVGATDPCLEPVVATDPAYYFGRTNAPSIALEKYVGESDADLPPGPAIPVGTTIQWMFIVTNTGNVTLTDVVVSDGMGFVPTCPKTTLEPGESMTCTSSSVAAACQHTNIATAKGKWAGGEVSAEDPANYFGEGHPAVALELKVNGDPSDVPPGPWIEEGATILFTYEVTNTGDVSLINIIVNDDRDRTPACPKTALEPGESMTCTASTAAVAGTYDVTGLVTGTPPCGDEVQATDPAYYRSRGQQASIDVLKMTNGVHSDAPPGPSVAIGSIVNWSYVVTNTGNVALTNVTVTDSGEVAVSCPKTTLEPGESMTCSASGLAQACQYSNTATATGTPPAGENVSANDIGYYFGQHNAAITVDKKTNGEDAVEPPGPSIPVGSAVTWTYVVTNTGDVTLTSIGVIDDRAGATSCPKTSLEPGQSMTCTINGTAIAGQQRNVATATGTPPCGPAVSASDASHYLGVTAGITIKKLVNGEDADDAQHALQLLVGTPIVWSYVVTNTGDVSLSDVAVSDNTIPTVLCPKTTLDPGESMTCLAGGFADPGLLCNIGTAVGTSPQDVTVTETDTACYIGQTAAISIEKRTNGNDADTPPGPTVSIGSTVQWTYVVTNTGEVQLTAVSVTDNRGVTVSCPKNVLAAGESMTCTASGTATSGQYSNIGTATGTPSGGASVTASDPSHYYGDQIGNQGCTPGYWKNHTDSWPPTGYSPSQTVLSTFSGSVRFPSLASATLIQALGFAGGSGDQGAGEILLRAGVAALLNAAHPDVAYPRTAESVITDVDTALAGTRDSMLVLAAALDADNNRGCPLN